MQQEAKLDITTFLNLMVVLIPFLLVSAVFSRVTIMELSVPTAAGGTQTAKPDFAIEIIVRQAGFEIANGFSVEAAIPKKEGAYDVEMLTKMLLRLKVEYPEKKDATILMESDIEYDHLIQVMDTVRMAEVPVTDGDLYPEKLDQSEEDQEKDVLKVVLFPEISIGDAP
jgi:biopolymer transport protein ExbD